MWKLFTIEDESHSGTVLGIVEYEKMQKNINK